MCWKRSFGCLPGIGECSPDTEELVDSADVLEELDAVRHHTEGILKKLRLLSCAPISFSDLLPSVKAARLILV